MIENRESDPIGDQDGRGLCYQGEWVWEKIWPVHKKNISKQVYPWRSPEKRNDKWYFIILIVIIYCPATHGFTLQVLGLSVVTPDPLPWVTRGASGALPSPARQTPH